MILTNRRHRLLYISLAGMVVASSLPLLYLLFAWIPSLQLEALPNLLARNPFRVFIFVWVIMLLYMFAADLINQPTVESPLREILIIALPVLTSLLAIRLFLYPTVPILSVAWLFNAVESILQFSQGLRIELTLVLINFYLWFRIALLTDNDLTFLHVGMSFRIAFLVSVAGNALLTILLSQSTELATYLHLLYLGFGLISVALARMDQMAVGSANSRGALLPWPRMIQIVASSLLLILAMVATARVFTPSALRSILGIFAPLWEAVRWILVQFIYLIFLLLTPLLERLAQLLEGLLLGTTAEPINLEPATPGEFVTIGEMVREVAMLRYCLVTLIVAVVVGLLLIFFVRTANRNRLEEAEETQDEKVAYGAGMAQRGLDRLRAWLQLLRNFGVSRELLDALTIENMYANLLRLADYRGFPRPPATPPDKFLATLQQLFPHNTQSLTDITIAYMRVYYGERAIDSAELERLRNSYRAIIESIDQKAETDQPENGE